ncbi:MAG: glycine cleavage system aminomethyltransferase GcvT [Bacteroidetes bacterium]|nr:glycine cleavage system aminomethyltransferase GcvT [Bacteroidota bacterium]
MTDTQSLKHVPLNDLHIAIGGKMVPFAGFNMPVQYSGLIPEHHAVRNNVGIFDVSHMGEFKLKGEGALDLIQRVTSNDASALFDGKIQYSCMPNDTGGIVDDLLVYRNSKDEYYLVVNAGNIDKDWNWLCKHNTANVQMQNLSDKISLFAIQGPNAIKVIQKLTDINLSEIEYYSFKIGTLAGKSDIIISNTGYTGAGGFEIYMNNEDAEYLWNKIMEAGKEYQIIPCGLGARDTLRLEKGFCLYGHDIDDNTSPIEAGLGWITKFTKEFTNSNYHKSIKENKPSKKLVGFKMIDRGIPRQFYNITDGKGNKIGEVTSGTQSPSLNIAIGMGYVKSENSKEGAEIFIEIRGKELKAQVVKIPFL